MLRTQRALSLSLSTLFLLGATLSAHADSATHGPFTVTSDTDFGGAFFFPKFNTSLGTLNSVILTLGNSMTTTLTITNNSGTASSGSARTELQAALYDTGTTMSTPGNILTASGGIFHLIDDFQTNPASYSLSGSGSTVLNPPTKNSSLSSSPDFTDVATLSYFTGTGNARVNYVTFTSTNLSNSGGNTTAAQATNDTLSATVVYNYTPAAPPGTPEPGTWAMMIAGSTTGLAVLRLRKKR